MTVYSYDLRQKVVEAYDQGELSQRKLASLFGVSLTFVQRILKRRRETGDVKAKVAVRKGPEPSLDASKLEVLRQLDRTCPDATHAELVELLRARHAITVSQTTVCRGLAALGLTRKKRSARQRA